MLAKSNKKNWMKFLWEKFEQAADLEAKLGALIALVQEALQLKNVEVRAKVLEAVQKTFDEEWSEGLSQWVRETFVEGCDLEDGHDFNVMAGSLDDISQLRAMRLPRKGTKAFSRDVSRMLRKASDVLSELEDMYDIIPPQPEDLEESKPVRKAITSLAQLRD